MNYGLMFTNVGPLTERNNFKEFVLQAEEDGIESIWVVDHSYIPVNFNSKYPYTLDGKLPLSSNTPLADPFVALSFAAAITEKIKLATGMLLVAQRHPLHIAKAMASLDQLSNGRAILGVGVGWLKEEFFQFYPYLDEGDWIDRGRITEEAISVIIECWNPDPVSFHSPDWQINECYCQPKPVNEIPIVIGGNSKIAARRAARIGDGYFPYTGDIKELEKLITIIKRECDKFARDPNEIEITALATDSNHDKYRAIGVSRLIV